MAVVKMENTEKKYQVGKVEVPALRWINLSIEAIYSF
jgi:hypothetical protein